MDPITQGLLGAAAAQALMTGRLGRRAWLYGAAGGMAADFDVLIRSSTDPMIALEYHRHFTHALAFVPVGGLLSALPWISWPRHRPHAKAIIAATTLGYATHGLLDAFTTYGTMLWWPVSQVRVAWNFVSIIDPIFTSALAIAVVLAAVRVRARPAWLGLVFATLYLAWGGVQHYRAVGAAAALATARGHAPVRVEAFPSLGNNVVWRTAYETDRAIVVDQARVPWFSSVNTRPGGAVQRLTQAELPPEVHADPDALEAVRIWAWFTDDWMARSVAAPEFIGDLRYSIDTGGIEPMWAIALRPGQTPPVEFEQFRGDAGGALSRLWDDIWGRPPPDGKPAQTNYVVPLKDAEQRQSPSGTGTVTILARGDNAFVAKLQMDPRAEVPEHRDPTEEYIHVLSGSGTMTIEGQRFAVEAGTTIYMPAHALVKFENGDAPLVALQVFAGPEPAEKYNLWVPVTP